MIKLGGVLILVLLLPKILLADTLELFFYKPPKTLNWHSPRSILMSTLQSYFTGASHPIGHVHVKISCDALPWKVHTGMTMLNSNDEYELLIKSQIGMGIVFYNFDGKLEHNDEVEQELLAAFNTNRINFLKLVISPTTCERLKNYYLEYKNNNYGKNYGLANKPLLREGAGCTAFAQSFLQLSGFSNFSFSQSWEKNIRIPDALIGDGINNMVSLFDILFTPAGDRWALNHEKGKDIQFWDIDTMYNWIETLWRVRAPMEFPFKKVKYNQAKGIQVNLSKIPTPQQPIWNN